MEELEINRREIARYLGYRSNDIIDDKTSAMIEECINEVNAIIEPKSYYDTFPIIWNGQMCEFAGINVTSKDLIKNLNGCKEAVMLAVTIGPGVDRLIRRAEVRDMSKALIFQSVGTEVVEAYCNKVNDEITKSYSDKGLYTRPRFSPGYGDFPLDVQKDFERVLNMRKNIGVSLSEGVVMTPTKSVTAVIGISDCDYKNKDEDNAKNCDDCNMSSNCAYKK